MCLYLKRNRFYSFCFVFILFIIVHNGMAQNSWFTQNSGTSVDLRAISVVNADTAYVVGDSGTILKSTNGGTVWQPLTSGTTEPLYSVFFINDTLGWVCGGFAPYPNVILKTTDGGLSWVSLPTPGPNLLYKIFFIDQEIGWLIEVAAFGPGKVYKTTDGGMSWSIQLIYSAYLNSVFFSNPNLGWAVGSDIIYHTNNGGAVWTTQSAPFDAELNSVFFLDSQRGWAAGIDRMGVNGRILRTTDGGSNWFRYNCSTALPDIYFIDTNIGFAVGENGSILGSGNGGITWTNQDSSVTDYLHEVEFANSMVGYVVGKNGVILKTENGGGIISAPTFTVDGTVTLQDTSDLLEGTIITLLEWTDITDTNGYYQLAGVYSGTYSLNFSRTGYEDLDTLIEVTSDMTVDVMLTISTPGPSVFFADDFEAYTAGTQLVVQNSTDWTTWSGTPGTGEDPYVSTTYANSGVNSVNVIRNNDFVKVMPNYTTGVYKISFDMYIPTGTVAYFNTLLEFTPTPQWGMQVHFNAGGAGAIDGGGQAAATFTYAYDKWLHNEVIVNLEKDSAEYYVDSVRIHRWQWSKGVYGGNNLNQLGGINFCGGFTIGSIDFYIDDYELKEIVPAIFTDNFDSYTACTQLVVQNPTDWITWSGGSGTGEDPFVSDAYANSSPNSVLIAPNNDVVKTFDSMTSGVYSISFMTFVPDGQTGYFNTLSGFTPNPNEWAMDCYFNIGGSGSLEGIPGGAVAFTYTHDVWFPVEVIVDLDQDLAELWVDSTQVTQWQWSQGSSNQLRLDAIDFNGGLATDEMYIDDFVFDIADALIDGIDDKEGALPITFDLKQNYPNPFNPSTKIKYTLPKSEKVKIEVFNLLGQKIKTLLYKKMPAGNHEIEFTGKNLPSGVYLYRIDAGKYNQVKKMILLK